MKGDYDVNCEYLAEEFIALTDLGTRENIEELAQVIQDAVDDWLAMKDLRAAKAKRLWIDSIAEAIKESQRRAKK